MEIIKDIASFEQLPDGSALTIGNFDGLHLGHQEIITTARQMANDRGGKLAIMTFDPHPLTVLRPEHTPGILMPLDLKEEILNEYGVDYFIIINDSYKLLNLSPRDFIESFIMKHVRPSVVVEGDNFQFGYGRSGNCQTLKELSREYGFEVRILKSLEIAIETAEKIICSSTEIRQFVEMGHVKSAMQVLSRPYRLMGKTVSGRGKGTELGFPTANIDSVDQVIPAEGVYAGFVSIAEDREHLVKADQKLKAAFSIGRAKTFLTDHPLLIEAHLLGECPEDLSDKFISMDFIEKIRNQRRFESEKELIAQISKDCVKVNQILDNVRITNA